MRTKIALQGGCIASQSLPSYLPQLTPTAIPLLKSNPDDVKTCRTIAKIYRARDPLSQLGRPLTETESNCRVESTTPSRRRERLLLRQCPLALRKQRFSDDSKKTTSAFRIVTIIFCVTVFRCSRLHANLTPSPRPEGLIFIVTPNLFHRANVHRGGPAAGTNLSHGVQPHHL